MSPTFEESIEIIDTELKKRRGKWRLSAIHWISYEDIANEIRAHIYNKWDQFDPNKGELAKWLNSIITNQLINKIKSYYGNYARPCLSCAHNQGEDLCFLYGKQCVECPLYLKWTKGKKRAYDVKLPVSLDNQYIESDTSQDRYHSMDFDILVPEFHAKMKSVLEGQDLLFYTLFYIEHKEEEEISKILGFKGNEPGRVPGYKHFQKMRADIYEIARAIVSEVV